MLVRGRGTCGGLELFFRLLTPFSGSSLVPPSRVTALLLMGQGYALLLDFLFNDGTSLLDIVIHDSWQLHLHSRHKIVLGFLQFIVNAGSALVKRVHLLLQFLGLGQGSPHHLLLKQ